MPKVTVMLRYATEDDPDKELTFHLEMGRVPGVGETLGFEALVGNKITQFEMEVQAVGEIFFLREDGEGTDPVTLVEADACGLSAAPVATNLLVEMLRAHSVVSEING